MKRKCRYLSPRETAIECLESLGSAPAWRSVRLLVICEMIDESEYLKGRQPSSGMRRTGLISFQAIRFREIAQIGSERWRLVLSCALIFMFIGGLYTAMTPRIYAAKAVITSPPGTTAGGFAMTTLKAFARSSIDSSSISASDPQQRYLLFQQLLTTEDVGRRMLNNYSFKYEIFSSNWDPATKKWRFNSSPIGFLKNTVLSLLQFKNPPEPGPRAMIDFISSNLSVDTDLTSGVTTLEFQYKDPQFAKTFLAALMKETDGIIRRSDVRMMSATLGDLDKQLPSITLQSESDALISQLSIMKVQLTQAKVGPEYSFSLIQKPEIEDRIVWPRPLLTLAVALLLGVCCGMMLAILGVRSIGTWWQFARLTNGSHKQFSWRS